VGRASDALSSAVNVAPDVLATSVGVYSGFYAARLRTVEVALVVYMNDQTNGKAHDVRMAGAATHAEENASDQPAERIAVEFN